DAARDRGAGFFVVRAPDFFADAGFFAPEVESSVWVGARFPELLEAVPARLAGFDGAERLVPRAGDRWPDGVPAVAFPVVVVWRFAGCGPLPSTPGLWAPVRGSGA